MNILQAVILSIVEGVTEFLPISSTGHLILASQILQVPQTEFLKSFEIIIQLGAIMAVLVFYFKYLLENRKIWPKILAGFLPTAVVGLAFYRLIKEFLIGNVEVVAISLILGGIFLIIFEKRFQEKKEHIESLDKLTVKQAFLIGLCQSVSVIPGVSRAGATILGGLFLGLKRTAAVEFSFMLAVPTMVAATTLDLKQESYSFSGDQWILLAIGLLGSFVSAVWVIRFFLKYIKHNDFTWFGVYRILVGIIFLLLWHF